MDGELLQPSTGGKPNITFGPFVLEGELREIPGSERPEWREASSAEKSRPDSPTSSHAGSDTPMSEADWSDVTSSEASERDL